ncbi:PstS family phosphate ABC transporter substrate-binding protein [Clostridium thermarum]|uniref:PstS family phosphate ABC transporter substrate-binding protein n=1 Tax=Clostridium thermarum TaxID=1716543 RepID=UPI0013D07975|nr:PstS family phosphate ABC transporter substrate-binding protein [Clostridium thermarum]
MVKSKMNVLKAICTVVLSTTLLMGCAGGNAADKENITGDNTTGKENTAVETKKLSGEIKIDGSSTVFPISQAMAEEFNAVNKDVKITVGESGTGGGMKKFINKEIDIADASRPMKQDEKDAAAKNGVEFIELKIAFDGLTVVINKENTWATDMTVEELNMMWKEGSTVKKWSDVRAEWPAEEIKFYAPGTASGTFEYFTEAINNKAKSGRAQDVTTSENDNVLVQGVAGDKNGISYFGYAYFEENKSKISAVKINGISPSFETIKDGTYKPLSRPLYIYVTKEALKREEVKEFVKFYLENATEIVPEVKYVGLPEEEYTKQLDLLK